MTERQMLRSERTDHAVSVVPIEAQDMRQWLQERVRLLPFRFGRRSAKMAIGTRVVVLKGGTNDDVGQMAIVSRHAGTQVEIEYRGPTGAWKKKRKAPASLIRLEEGLQLVLDEDRCPVIRRMPEEAEDEREGGIISDEEDEIYAQ
jgi:hypothetical protein